ncbi:MAG: alpha/beta fold hydrolase [Dehalococcoidia bacterium]|nr:MAG: alpha/beta fold hydrolase [Dehalococcoidia bacterium]
MPKVTANGIQIEYDTFGDPSDPPLLLISGNRAQLVGWPEPLRDQLAEQGFRVIRFDNRDVGISSKMDDIEVPTVFEIIASREKGEEVRIPYTLDDMADDTIGLLDALDIEKAHIFGVSMGGMIAQLMAIRYPSRVLTLISMMCGTAGTPIENVKPELVSFGLTPMPADRAGYVEYNIKLHQLLAGSRFPLDKRLARQIAQLSYDRCYCPQGVDRQMAAIMSAWDRTHALNSVKSPTLVILGSEDPAIAVDDSRAVAEAVPGAELLIIEGLGHGLLFPDIWSLWVESVTKHIRKADG